MIAVRYSCPQCNVTDATVQVRLREPGEDVLKWMDAVTAALGADHAERSPHCHPDRLANVKIPLTPGAPSIGFPAQN